MRSSVAVEQTVHVACGARPGRGAEPCALRLVRARGWRGLGVVFVVIGGADFFLRVDGFGFVLGDRGVIAGDFGKLRLKCLFLRVGQHGVFVGIGADVGLVRRCRFGRAKGGKLCGQVGLVLGKAARLGRRGGDGLRLVLPRRVFRGVRGFGGQGRIGLILVLRFEHIGRRLAVHLDMNGAENIVVVRLVRFILRGAAAAHHVP
jgi:hypothetical protein